MDALAHVCEEVARFSSRNRKISILAEYLRGLDDADLGRAVRFLAVGPMPGEKLSIGYATMRDAMLAATGLDAHILAICYREVGDSGETVSHLMRGRTQNEPLSLSEAELLYARLFKSRRTADKVELLRQTFVKYRPGALKFFVKVITGKLRIGLQSKMVEEAVAEATAVPYGEVRQANNRVGDLPLIAVSARRGTLHQLEARIFHPMEFMLAKPLENLADLSDPENWWVEDKYDGIRSQIHVKDGRVMIFTRGMEEATRSFPEICEALRVVPESAVLDGELLAWKNGRSLAFTVLQQRIARKKLTEATLADIPVVFVAYDLLYWRGRMLDDVPVEERRAALEEFLLPYGPPLLIAPRNTASTQDEVDTHFLEARERGNEGLVLKRRGSVYESGRRSGTWLKVKRPYGTLDVVITAAEQGHGRRAVFLSDYTFAVKAGEGFVNVGKAYSGLTDQEVRELTRILRASAVERFGRVMLVKPEVVLEVAFDGVQKSARHKGGFALRFPRILRWRKDKSAAECDSIEQVREMYEASLA